MDHLKEFIIPFRGLKEGLHHFEYDIDGTFFKNFEYAELSEGKVKVALALTVSERMLVFDFTISGSVEVMCDRCLGRYDEQIAGTEKLIVKLGDEPGEISDEVVIVAEGAYQFDISRYIYEYIVLLVPMQHIHPDDENGISTCDREMTKRLEEMKGSRHTDPRWEALKALKKEK
jgi:uncharacterized metal-binding protein YceD (DUF177 family)